MNLRVFSEDISCLSREVQKLRPKPRMTGDLLFKLRQIEETLARGHRTITFFFEDRPEPAK